MSERNELIRVRVKFDADQAWNHREQLLAFCAEADGIQKGAAFIMNYEFTVDYFGNVSKRLDQINEIMAWPEVAIEASLEELRHGESVLLTTIDRIRAAQTALNFRLKTIA